jgi:aryl-alcohol dehydrogenase-like predicted oxidoreductase
LRIETRFVSSKEIEVTRIGLGCVTFGREIDEGESYRVLDHADSFGINFFDTAEAYGEGASERIVGHWLEKRGRRDDIVLQTKVTTCFTHEHVREAVEKSLDRLRTDHLDIYLMHSFDRERPIEEALEAMAWVLDSRKARVIGCSNFTAWQLRLALQASIRLSLPRLEVIQPVYNLVAREAEEDLFPLCLANRLGIMTYSPLAAGFLTGKYTEDRAAMPAGSRFAIRPAHADLYFTAENFRTVERLRDLSLLSKKSMPLLAMAWALSCDAIDCVLVGARAPEHLDNAVAALSARSALASELRRAGM